MKKRYLSWLSLALFYFLTHSHACRDAESGSLWELDPTKIGMISAKSSNSYSTIAILQSKNESFSLILLWDFSTLSWQASIANVASGSHVCTSRAFFSSATQICTLLLEENENLMLKQANSVLWESHTCGLYVKSLKILDDCMLIDFKGKGNHMVLQSSKERKLNFPRRFLQGSNSSPSYTGSSNFSSSNEGLDQNESSTDGGHRNKKALAMEIVFPVVSFLLLAFCLGLVFARRRKAKKAKTVNQINAADAQKSRRQDDEALLETLAPGLPPRFTYAEMLEATNGFQKKLGEGGYGAVYEGVLPSSGSKIAVKVFLDTSSIACRKGFCAEVMSIGEKTHSNLVQLRGFCVEDDYRMLVYELMENGSLNKVLFGAKAEESKGLVLSWERRKAIAIDTARALAFLHEEGEEKTPVIHCDVKPENILLNENWVAKVSDFGLAKLLWSSRPHHEEEKDDEDDGKSNRMQTPLSIDVSSKLYLLSGKGVRGTLGYLAPEWIRADAGPDTISTSSDVYSFGVVLLEIIAGRRSMVPGHPFLPGHAFDMLADGRDLSELLDPCLHAAVCQQEGASHGTSPSFELGDVQKSVNVALWCLQEDLTLRPTMMDVLDMLTDKVPVASPPFCDYFAGSSHFFDEVEYHDHSHIFSDLTSSSHDKVLKTSTSTTHETGSWQVSILSGR